MVGIYTRKSKKASDKETSIEIQLKKGISFAKSIDEEYIIFNEGTGKSGRKHKKNGKDIIKEYRPKFASLIDSIKKSKVTKVYVYDQSRLERNVGLWEIFCHNVNEAGCKYFPSGNELDLTTAISKMQTTIISAVNQYYADYISERTTEAFQHRAELGLTHGIIPYGYTKGKKGEYVFVPQEAEIVDRIFNESLSGKGTYIIAKGLNSDKIPTKYNSYDGKISRKDDYTGKEIFFEKSNIKWRGNVILDMIKNPIYKGFKKWNDELYDIHINIISPARWELANDNLVKNKKKAGKRPEFNYLLNGLIFCSDCGSPYHGKRRTSGRNNTYICKGGYKGVCTHSDGISIPKLESFIVKLLFRNKMLQSYLNSIKSNRKETDVLQGKLNKAHDKFRVTTKRVDRAYDLLFEQEEDTFAKDDRIKVDYTNSKNELKRIQEEINTLIIQISERNEQNRITRINNIIDGFDYNHPFDTIKVGVHGLISKIIKGSTVDGKSIIHFININFKGFDESMSFMTKKPYSKWHWIKHYKSGKSLSPEELKEDIELVKYLGIDSMIDMGTFKGFDTSSARIEPVIINEKDIILFN